MVVNLPLTSGVPMRSLKHFEVAQLTRIGNGAAWFKWIDLYGYDGMEDMVLWLWMKIDLK